MGAPFPGKNEEMRASRLSLVLVSLLPFLLAACGEPQDTRPGQPVAHRKAAFKEILNAFEPMGVQLRDEGYKPDVFLAKAKELDSVKDKPWSYFQADTNYPPTEATDKVWSDSQQFEHDRQAFIDATSRLVVVAQSKDIKQVAPAYEALHDTCRTCHKTFKK
jgi:cytochrome c556